MLWWPLSAGPAERRTHRQPQSLRHPLKAARRCGYSWDKSALSSHGRRPAHSPPTPQWPQHHSDLVDPPGSPQGSGRSEGPRVLESLSVGSGRQGGRPGGTSHCGGALRKPLSFWASLTPLQRGKKLSSQERKQTSEENTEQPSTGCTADGHWPSVVRRSPVPGEAGRSSPPKAAGFSAFLLQTPAEGPLSGQLCVSVVYAKRDKARYYPKTPGGRGRHETNSYINQYIIITAKYTL